MKRLIIAVTFTFLLLTAFLPGAGVSPASADSCRISTSGTGSGITFGTTYNINAGETVTGSITDSSGTVDLRIALGGITTYHGFVPLTATLSETATVTTTVRVDYNGGGTYSWTLQIGCTGIAVYAPAGFVIHYITCDVAVFSERSLGRPTSARITNGQRWYVSEKPVLGKDGQNWTEVFVGSSQDGFIPTRCVGAAWKLSDGK